MNECVGDPRAQNAKLNSPQIVKERGVGARVSPEPKILNSRPKLKRRSGVNLDGVGAGEGGPGKPGPARSPDKGQLPCNANFLGKSDCVVCRALLHATSARNEA